MASVSGFRCTRTTVMFNIMARVDFEPRSGAIP
jgi:hypothetical protein